MGNESRVLIQGVGKSPSGSGPGPQKLCASAPGPELGAVQWTCLVWPHLVCVSNVVLTMEKNGTE